MYTNAKGRWCAADARSLYRYSQLSTLFPEFRKVHNPWISIHASSKTVPEKKKTYLNIHDTSKS
jgi:hypothetical protein